MKKERLDILVQRKMGVAPSKAQGLIYSRCILACTGEVLDKPGLRLPEDIEFELKEEPRYVSRGGEKLEAALDGFGLNVEGCVAIDVGASTGGFTDCLLQHGASKVYAVDVGYGQLDWKLRNDERVIVMERTNIRNVTPDQIAERPVFFTADCSFISLRLVLHALKVLLADQAEGVVLIKPQFEAEKEQVSRGGVVRETEVHEQVVRDVIVAAEKLGFHGGAVIPSPLLGPAGNREFLAHLYTGCKVGGE